MGNRNIEEAYLKPGLTVELHGKDIACLHFDAAALPQLVRSRHTSLDLHQMQRTLVRNHLARGHPCKMAIEWTGPMWPLKRQWRWNPGRKGCDGGGGTSTTLSSTLCTL